MSSDLVGYAAKQGVKRAVDASGFGGGNDDQAEPGWKKWYNKSFFVFPFCWIAFRIHISFLVYAGLALLTSLFHHNALGKWFGFAIVMLALHFMFLWTHELGHWFAMKRFAGEDLVESAIAPFGSWSIHFVPGFDDQVKVALAGPATHLAWILWWIILAAASGGVRWELVYMEDNVGVNICNACMMLNVMLLLCNLFVPVYPMDCAPFYTRLIRQKFPNHTVAVLVGVNFVVFLLLMIWGCLDDPASLFTILMSLWVLWQMGLMYYEGETHVLLSETAEWAATTEAGGAPPSGSVGQQQPGPISTGGDGYTPPPV